MFDAKMWDFFFGVDFAKLFVVKGLKNYIFLSVSKIVHAQLVLFGPQRCTLQ